MLQQATKRIVPQDPVQGLLSRAMDYHQKNKLSQAKKYYKRVLKIDSQHPDALHLLGIIFHQMGHDRHAVELIRKAIANESEQAIFHTNLAIIYNSTSQWNEAEAAARDSLQINSNDPKAWGNLGQALAGLERISDAIKAYEKSISFDPRNYIVHCNLASLLTAFGRYEEAEAACKAALKLNPNLAKAFHSLGVVQSVSGRLNKAEKSFKKALSIEPNNGQTITNLASIYTSQLKYDDAIALFKNVIKVAPNSAEVHNNLGVCYSEVGQLDEALRCFEHTLVIDPNNVEAHYALATSGRKILSPNDLSRLERISRSTTISLEKKIKLNFVLASQADQRGLTLPAITFFKAGNDLRKKLLNEQGHKFNAVEQVKLEKSIENIFTKEFFESRIGFGINTQQPVFIVGMPRSGTTLVEKILSSHPEVHSVGESNNIPKIIEKLEEGVNNRSSFLQSVKYLGKGLSAELGISGLASLGNLSYVSRIVDKMPLNYVYLGLIALLYPKAKIIHCQRHPCDIANSCYFQNFVNIQPWSCDLKHIANYYNSYRRIMAHWDKVLPLSILNLRYEELVNNYEKKIPNLVKFIGIDWNERCLNFYETQGAVRTASKWQVRQPIYTNSVGRWKIYEDYLAPFKNTLVDPYY